jgi:S-adenosylmethionine decarboxylase
MRGGDLGTEWIVDAAGCLPERLADLSVVRALLERVVADLELRPIAEPCWHKFSEGGAGVSGAYLLRESHLTVHTFPERGAAAINLYCCRARPEWPWRAQLGARLGAREVTVEKRRRGIDLP